jgi:predicted AlkP superfamily phosphohydrolase/phosphomutase
MGNRALAPEDIYPEVVGIPPDLIVYLGDLRWRSIGTIGNANGFYNFENDTGPDDANHSEVGLLIATSDEFSPEFAGGMSLLDVAPTVQALLGLAPPPGQRGTRLL